MWSRPDVGPFTFAFRLCLFFGGGIGLFFLGLPGRNEQHEPSKEVDSQQAADHVNAPTEPTRPKWKGDREGNRRRLIIITIVLAVLVGAFAVYVWTQSPG